MRLRKISFFILSFVLVFLACKKDDDASVIESIPPRDRQEVQDEDKTEIDNYLESHYYNSSEFEAIANPSSADIIITKRLEGESIPDGHTLLMESPLLEIKKVDFANINYEFYVLKLNQGGGFKSPAFSDDIVFTYEGFLLSNTIFDKAVSAIRADLYGTNEPNSTGLITGWRKVVPDFNVSESFVTNSDGTENYINHGVGVMFLPSGLAYFLGTTGIPAYTPIAFKFDLLNSFENDHDNDGVPSYLEEVFEDGEFYRNSDGFNNGDDTDDDGLPNYVDADDDGDGVLTINEDINGDGDPTNDIGANGIANYLDATETASKE